MSLGILIFSKNRAMQLDALLQSIARHMGSVKQSDVHILYTCDLENHASYAELSTAWSGVRWFKQRSDRSFEQDLKTIIAEMACDRVCLFTDDDIVYRPARLSSLWISKEDEVHSLRLGSNIKECYNVPDQPKSDFNYLFSVDGCIYRCQQLGEWIGAIGRFDNPNTLEFKVNQLTGPAKPGQIAYAARSSVVNVPHNIVTTAWRNRSMNKEASELNRLFQAGLRIDLDQTFEGVTVTATHQEIPYKFQEAGPRIVEAPLFSICHATARIEGTTPPWFAAYSQAMQNADRPELVEYIICVDHPAAKTSLKSEAAVVRSILDRTKNHAPQAGLQKVIVHPGEAMRGCVGPKNTAATYATGAIFINAEDDIFFPPHWDTELLKACGSQNPLTDEFFLHVSSGSPRDDRLFIPQIYSRARYLAQGYSCPPCYDSVFSDDELTERAYHDNAVIEARHILFEHRHPAMKKGEWDEVYAAENASDRYKTGKETIERRRKEFGFGPEDIKVPKKTLSIAICVPGERFGIAWNQAWTNILTSLRHYDLFPVFQYSTNVYITRHAMIAEIQSNGITPDYVVWIDDDNIVVGAQIQMLIDDLEANPQLDGVAGWCWCAFNPPVMSCGRLTDRGFTQPYTEEALKSASADLVPVEYTGFPLFVTRWNVYEKLGQFPFRAFVSDWWPYGMAGEDTSFSIRGRLGKTRICLDGVESAIEGKGLVLCVDRRVRVVHLKEGDLNGPKPVSANAEQPKPETSVQESANAKDAEEVLVHGAP